MSRTKTRTKSKPASGLGKLPLPLLVGILVIVIAYSLYTQPGPRSVPPAAPPGSYLFCFWNCENLFDDRLDRRGQNPDREYDSWFAQNPTALNEKLDHLTQALLTLNDGRGPDILAVAELESTRAAVLLCEALNRKLDNPDLHYPFVVMKEIGDAGRHIAPAVISRVPVATDHVYLLGGRQRILETHVQAGNRDLTLIVSHWTSRVSDETGSARARYADTIYNRIRTIHQSIPGMDLLVCGDFNDTPDDASVRQHLHATHDLNAVSMAHAEPLLLNLFAGKDPAKFGTISYRNRPYIFDQLVVSPGLLDGHGWVCEPDTATTVNNLTADTKGRPLPFGDERDRGPRGYSDHFPVTVRLRVVD